MPAPRPWKLSEVRYGHVKETSYEVAVLPLGATEPHNLHLPYGTDDYEGTMIGERICEAAHAQGAKVILLPTMPYGTETNMRKFPLAMNVNPSTLYAVVTDLVQSLVESGIKKVVLLNSHGGNEMKPLLRELYGKTEAHVFLCNWFKVLDGDDYHQIFKHNEDHAGEMETSLILAYNPELVARRSDGSFDADSGAVRPMQFEALEKGWVSITRPWHLLTTNSGSGNPHEATAEKGEQLLQILANRLAPFLVQLSAANVDDSFPFEVNEGR
ncbi:creatininase family protein [Bremerella cremea]|uniref:creatininase family protein n=1 Tax=Bremerella cremea TaxID=1031537 RepID=UPI0031F1BBAE